MRRLLHLVRRFVGSLWPAGPSSDDDRWARAHLSDAETRLWDQMAPVDRRHATRVARRVDEVLGPAPADVVAAALMHDVGKTLAGLGAIGRVAATVAVSLLGEDRVRPWAGRRGVIGRIGVYVDYPERGVALLADADSDPMVIAWSCEHHRPEDAWEVPVAIGRVLVEADDRA